MKIGILTLPLGNNYGGVLQNYALQQVLRRLGHEPITINFRPKMPLWIFFISTIKSIVFFFIPSKRRKFVSWPKIQPRSRFTVGFIDKHICLTDEVTSYSNRILKQYQLDGVIVGSDQVWRPRYNGRELFDSYLRFVKGSNKFRVAYAASFGVDIWEYSPRQSILCKKLINRFDAISVRERSGIALCEEHFGVTAVEVLDPTLLLSANDYITLCKEIPKSKKPSLVAYLLDPNDEKRSIVEALASRNKLSVNYIFAHNNIGLTIEDWLAMFRDAPLVVTDSFHGTVFSIIHHTDFISIPNKGRGLSRFESLLSNFELTNRMIGSLPEVDNIDSIDWERVDKLIHKLQISSINFLKDSLTEK